jgi:uncharacterized protein YndB with AHSA1/START domain
MTDSLKKERTFQQPIEKVWKAISRGEEISKWFIQADFKPEVGYEYTFTATEEHGGTRIRGKVLQASPYDIKYTWIVGDGQGETLVHWHLEEMNDSTKLVLTHSGMAQFPEASAIEMMGHFDAGWEACFATLAQYINDEVTAPAH